MQPINVDDKLHTDLKIKAATSKEKMYEIINRYIIIGMWYDTLVGDQKKAIAKQIDKFLTDKAK